MCEELILTRKLPLDVVQVGGAGVADGDGRGGHPGAAVHIQEVPRDWQLQDSQSERPVSTWNRPLHYLHGEAQIRNPSRQHAAG